MIASSCNSEAVIVDMQSIVQEVRNTASDYTQLQAHFSCPLRNEACPLRNEAVYNLLPWKFVESCLRKCK